MNTLTVEIETFELVVEPRNVRLFVLGLSFFIHVWVEQQNVDVIIQIGYIRVQKKRCTFLWANIELMQSSPMLLKLVLIVNVQVFEQIQIASMKVVL